MCDKLCCFVARSGALGSIEEARRLSVRVESNLPENEPASCKVIRLVESQVLLPVQMYLLLGVLDGRHNIAALVF